MTLRRRSRAFNCLLVALLVALAPGGGFHAATIYVDASNNSGTFDGSQQFPYASIQDAIFNAATGDNIQVAAGTYFETISMKDGVSVFGEDPATTIIDGTGQENSVVVFNETRFSPRLEGFTITGGDGDFRGFLGGDPIFIGGGILILDSSPVITNTIISGNVMTEGIVRGAGIYITNRFQSPTIVGNVISGNVARSSTVEGRGEGGGIFIESKSASALITENLIEMNEAVLGGGLYSQNNGDADVTVQRNTFQLNQADKGSAIFSRDFADSSHVITNNLLVNNGTTAGARDCNDTDAEISPALTEVCNDGKDNDCDGATPDIFDGDGDGTTCELDCDDGDPSISPTAAEQCGDMIDNDCDGNIDLVNPENIVLIEQGSPMVYLSNSADPAIPALDWVLPMFDDSAWTPGDYGLGYEADMGADNLVTTIVPADALSVYSRATFDVDDSMLVNAMFFGADWDAGYVVWINGVEVLRSAEMPVGDPLWNTDAAAHESSNGVTPDYGTLVDISTEALPALVNGLNVMAVGIWNESTDLTDLVLVPRLSMSYGADDPDCLCPDTDGDLYACDDCDDSSPDVLPGGTEVCNDGIDNDCDPSTLDIFDADGDGFNCAIDCNDADPAVNPAALEVDCDGVDNDCNALTPDVVDNDGDNVTCEFDCADDNPAIRPGALEFCFDGVDNNCDGDIDSQDIECSCPNPVDNDSDGFRCTDCDDMNPNVRPNAGEVCNDAVDNDCDPATPDIFDGDGDGELCDTDCMDTVAGVNSSAAEKCDDGIDNDCDGDIDVLDSDCGCGDGDGDGYECLDCDDAVATTFPGAPELCNDGVDNDCDMGTPDLLDADMDGEDCVLDCNDNDPAINPSAPEDCADLVDNDCDGFVDAVNPDLVVVEFGAAIRYISNLTDPGVGIAWVQESYNDTSWNTGVFGIGYEFSPTGIGVQDLAATVVADGTLSVYSRARFTIPDITAVNGVFTAADYDDGYIIWINGTEVFRSPEMPAGVPQWDADPALHESSNGQVPDYGPLTDVSTAALPVLHEGVNVMAVGVYNDIPSGGGFSSDLVVVPRLSLDYGNDDADCVCPDADGDGFRCNDCNDMNPQISPGLPEIGCDGIDNDCNGGTPDILDGDMDGHACDVDCVDSDPDIFPGAMEIICDFFDNDCNPATFDVQDLDSDGFNCLFDCDETNFDVNPSQTEIVCDGLDNDCDTQTGDLRDQDLDGFMCLIEDCADDDPAINPAAAEKCNDTVDNDCDDLIDAADDTECGCGDMDLDGYECLDCDDTTDTRNPGLTEVCNDGIDNDCDALTLDVDDADGDGFDCLADCDDTNPFARPNAAEMCGDGVDNDCNPGTPDIFDFDADLANCDVDCNDKDPTIFPGAEEICNDTIDNDCDSLTADIRDVDLDGVNCIFDCNDTDDTISPNEPELCNDGIDNDCNPTTPDVFDGDADGTSCELDCDDNDPGRNPGVPERCDDGIDNDCDTDTDNSDSECTGCGPDSDGDGYECADCNEGDPNINPGAAEICNDTIDNDCNALTLDVGDQDSDGFACDVDCLDSDPAVFPGAVEICGDAVDNDCNAGTPDVLDLDSDTFFCDVDCDETNPQINPGRPEIGCDMIDNDCSAMTSDLADIDGDMVSCVDVTVSGGAITAFASLTGTVTIVNNTLVGNAVPNGVGGALSIDDMGSSVPGLIANNVFVDNVGDLAGAIEHSGFFGELRNNLFFNNTGGDLYGGGSGLNASGNQFIDPQFVGQALGNYRPAAGSPLIDAADPTTAPLNDIDRFDRPYDGDGDTFAVADIGAFEYPSGETLNLRFTDHDTLVWDLAPGETLFNVYRGRLSNLIADGEYTQRTTIINMMAEKFCAVPLVSLPFVDTFTPGNSRTAFYLATVVTAGFEGSLGNTGQGGLRPNDHPCP